MTDYLKILETCPSRFEGKSYGPSDAPWCTIRKQVVGPYYLIQSHCRNCPGFRKCKNANGCGYISVDNIPDTWYDMPCSSGCAGRELHIMTSKVTNESIVSGNYHHEDDFCKFLCGWRNPVLSDSQEEYVSKHYGSYPNYRESNEDEYSVRFVTLDAYCPLKSGDALEVQVKVEFCYEECLKKIPTLKTVFDVELPRKPIIK